MEKGLLISLLVLQLRSRSDPSTEYELYLHCAGPENMDAEKKRTLLLSVQTLTGDLRKMVENGRRSYQSAPDINDFVKSHSLALRKCMACL